MSRPAADTPLPPPEEAPTPARMRRAWGETAVVLAPGPLAGARLYARTRGGAEPAWPLLDTEPWRSETFYDQSPFGVPSGAAPWRPDARLVEALAGIGDDARVAEVGSGGGRNVPALLGAASEVVVLDQSLRSVELVAAAHPVRAVRGSALALPFLDASFDAVVCEGVAHHTGDVERALAEVARVTRPGGRMYVTVYRSPSRYQAIYHTLGSALRAARELGTAAPAVARAIDHAAFAGYRAATRVVKRGRTGDRDALRSVYEDYFLTPIATFHRPDDIRALLERAGCVVDELAPYRNQWLVIAHRIHVPPSPR
ncbi:MAG TPA: methyltransferase domain-containing protein [Longimicrobium sp.]|nr:methyltransferase domain-containing protein [Longimicrobium sp.]